MYCLLQKWDDEFGRRIIKSCEEKGAKTSFIKAVGEDTSYTIVLSPPGFDRSFLHFTGTNDTFKFDGVKAKSIGERRYFNGKATIKVMKNSEKNLDLEVLK